jgi:hypothetical protein
MSEKPKLLGYLLKKWVAGRVISEREFPPTAKGLRAANRVKKSFKSDRPGRDWKAKGGAQDVTITPVYERAEI